VGKTISASQTSLATNEFEVGLSICQGDSGGPAISETTGAIVGVVSRGGNCTDTSGHIYTSLTAFASVFQAAFALAGGAPVDESGTAPPPLADAGGGGGTGVDGGTGGGDETPTDPTPRPQGTNLRAGAGNNCSASGAPSPSATELGGIALGMLAALGMLVARRRRADD
jgi:MYXO-CTERM domain-containing protein